MYYVKTARGLLEFINNSPTCYHAVKNVTDRLEQAGYQTLYEKESYELEAGKKYYVVRNDSSVIAFELPKKAAKGFRITASHSDSPCFKLKESPDIILENTYVKFNVEKYGGMILSTWLDRPLSVAGRVVVREIDGIVTKLIDFEENLCIIPNVAIHLNREINKGVEYNPQIDMQPLWSGDGKTKIYELIREKLQLRPGQILGADLFVYNKEQACFIGYENSFIGAPRLDDLECVYGALEGFLNSENENYIRMYCVFDHEEVGSCTRQGADSDFLSTTLQRIAKAMKYENHLAELFADSMLISADNGHALHPNHPEKADQTNRPLLNKGLIIKYHGNQQYTTDAYTGAVVKNLCEENLIPYQTYHNRSDVPGGSTLGNISIAHCSIPSADVGLPQLAMHSAFETAGTEDLEAFKQFVACFYEFE